MKKQFISFSALAIFFFSILVSCNNEKNETNTGNNTDTTSNQTKPTVANPDVSKWMSWEGGMDVAGVTDTSLKMPNVIFHIARMVHTPVGSAPSGMILYQPDTSQAPLVMGFVSTNKSVGDYFGANIFAGTPFETAPTVMATFDVKIEDNMATAKVVAGGHTFECIMSNLGTPYLINREPMQMPPFYQQGVERIVGKTVLKVDGKEVIMMIPSVGISGGPASVVSPNGIYAR